MEPRVEIGELALRYAFERAPRDRAALAAWLDETAVRALEHALEAIDDGRIVVVRHVSVRARLDLGKTPRAYAASAWADAIVAEVRRAMAAGEDAVVVFDDALSVLEAYVRAAQDGALGAWFWQEPALLEAAQRGLADVPRADGTHAYAGGGAPPASLTAARAIAWAFAAAGGALPALVQRLHERRRAVRAIALLPPAIAAELVAPWSSRRPIDRTAVRLPEQRAAPEPTDPRNVLLVTALALAASPALSAAVDVPASAREALAAGDPPSPREERSAPAAIDARSRYAGLFLLLTPLARLEAFDAIAAERTFALSPGAGAVLYGIACRLAPDAFADPAALTLAGADAPPSMGEDRPELAAAVARARARIEAARVPRLEHAGDASFLAASAEARPASLAPPAALDAFFTRLAALLLAVLRARLDAPDLDAPALVAKVLARRGAIRASGTHVDVDFEIDALDVDIRRAALDVDPGWVPILGRVVRFHYV